MAAVNGEEKLVSPLVSPFGTQDLEAHNEEIESVDHREDEHSEYDERPSIPSEKQLLLDHEAQSPLPPAPPTPGLDVPIETRITLSKKLLHLGAYFSLNLSLTMYNKICLGRFAYPCILTAIHATCLTLGCTFLLMRGHFHLTKLNLRENLILAAFSSLFTANIAVSNASLAAVSVPFHQIMRSTCPVFTVIIQRFLYSRSYSTTTYMSLVPIVFGVGLATFGDYYYELFGFLLTLLGVILACIKTIATNRLMVGPLKLSPMELLLRMSPLAAVQCIIYAFLTGEGQALLGVVRESGMELNLFLALLGNGILAFFLNVTSFKTNKVAGALTMTVAGNVKQCLTILLGIFIFNVKATPTNGLGMAIAVMGAAWYSKVELDNKNKR